MKTRSRTLGTAIAIITTIGLAFSAHAEEKLTKSATLTLKGWKIAFIGSVGQSKGELNYKGKTRKFKMTGLGIGGVGISTSEATGVVYNMKTVEGVGDSSPIFSRSDNAQSVN